MTLYINLFGTCGAGKSTMAADIFARLKAAGVKVELVREYVKEKVWDGVKPVSLGQFYIAAKQFRKEWQLDGKVDVVVTDSPWRLSALYASVYGGGWSPFFERAFEDLTDGRNELNVFVHRTKPFVQAGRVETEEQSDALAGIFRSALVEDRRIDLLEVGSGETDAVLAHESVQSVTKREV